MATNKLMATGEAAKHLGISRSTLTRWWQRGMVEPEFVTAGGQARWDLDGLLRQLDELRKRQRDEQP